MNKILRHFFATMTIALFTVAGAEVATAAPGDISEQLSLGESFTVKAKRNCSLSVTKETVKRVNIRCISQEQGTISRAAGTLKRGRRASFTAKGCFLAVASRSDRRVKVKCIKKRPTPTPTATATPTITATPTPTVTPTANAQAMAANNVLISFNTSDPANTASLKTLSGVATPQNIVSIDRRPQTGALYGLGYNSTTGEVQLYRIWVPDGVASAVGSTGSFVDGSANPVRIGVDELTSIGMDFNPTVDRVRVVTDSGQNFRINPNTGAFVDGNLGGSTTTGVNTDGAINGATTTVGETAYTNNSPNSTATTQYTVDESTDSIYIQTPPNSGTQGNAQALTLNGQALSIVEARGFDIPLGVDVTTSNTAVTSGSGHAIFEFASDSQQKYCQVDLTNGAVSQAAQIGNGSSELLGLAVQSATSRAIVALDPSNNLVRFSSGALGTTTTVPTSGVTTGETLVGIDYRPTTGELFGLGIDPTADTGTLYIVDPQTGAATAVGAASSVTNGDFPSVTSGWGFNFNPTADRIRVVTSTGLNFRLNPTSGAVSADTALNGAATGVHATSYTNSFAGATVTTLYTLDASSNKLLIQNPPNGGLLTEVATVSVDFDFIAAFEIPTSVTVTASGSAVTSGTAFAALTVSGVTSLYSIDLITGTATSLGTIGTGSTAIQGLAVGEVDAR